MAEEVRTIAEATNKAIASTPWSKVAIAENMGMLPQGLNDKLMRNKNPKIDFVARVLKLVGYELAVVPCGARLPQGAIVIAPDAEESTEPPKKPMNPISRIDGGE